MVKQVLDWMLPARRARCPRDDRYKELEMHRQREDWKKDRGWIQKTGDWKSEDVASVTLRNLHIYTHIHTEFDTWSFRPFTDLLLADLICHCTNFIYDDLSAVTLLFPTHLKLSPSPYRTSDPTFNGASDSPSLQVIMTMSLLLITASWSHSVARHSEFQKDYVVESGDGRTDSRSYLGKTIPKCSVTSCINYPLLC
jgi:hypothetical protein